MFGSPMEDGRVVGSGSPPRENGKVDREIGLPPVPATEESRITMVRPRRGGGGKEAGVTAVRNASQRLAGEHRSIRYFSPSSRDKRRKSREEPARAPTADDDEDDAISSPGHPPVLRLSARAPLRRCSRSHPLQPEIGYRDWSIISDRKLVYILSKIFSIDALQTKRHENVYTHTGPDCEREGMTRWSRGELFLALPTIVQSARVCRVSRRRLVRFNYTRIDRFAISNSKYTIFVKTNVRSYATGHPTCFSTSFLPPFSFSRPSHLSPRSYAGCLVPSSSFALRPFPPPPPASAAVSMPCSDDGRSQTHPGVLAEECRKAGLPANTFERDPPEDVAERSPIPLKASPAFPRTTSAQIGHRSSHTEYSLEFMGRLYVSPKWTIDSLTDAPELRTMQQKFIFLG
ncbi:hypothetical protein ALC62_08177 [Cyphomyrmex costatus]|uniref:Uncharacterized protein n=1 Tax=Cyphomyrmex costatus TaxID=456900 RepID=A0A195CJP4_9HYME|nr:hypothetical protein ALC62_08177 [Cyphomyrmex costatus]